MILSTIFDWSNHTGSVGDGFQGSDQVMQCVRGGSEPNRLIT